MFRVLCIARYCQFCSSNTTDCKKIEVTTLNIFSQTHPDKNIDQTISNPRSIWNPGTITSPAYMDHIEYVMIASLLSSQIVDFYWWLWNRLFPPFSFYRRLRWETLLHRNWWPDQVVDHNLRLRLSTPPPLGPEKLEKISTNFACCDGLIRFKWFNTNVQNNLKSWRSRNVIEKPAQDLMAWVCMSHGWITFQKFWQYGNGSN